MKYIQMCFSRKSTYSIQLKQSHNMFAYPIEKCPDIESKFFRNPNQTENNRIFRYKLTIRQAKRTYLSANIYFNAIFSKLLYVAEHLNL